MTRRVNCVKLGIEADGLDAPPFPGPKGLYIFDHVSKQAWKDWLAMQTMIINERRLASFDLAAKKILETEREKFLFAGGFEMPEGYVPQKN
ncbi:MAG: oxidative damage protection protein [Methylomonas sp.]|nr:MAG: oxidative damage protection protein [Methylomonas sp.]PPD27923.1 MAG: oxidative damage protection protein [Methylomonas sp.]PPD40033.1 MAG: oxidative damage protection protein [Methylomonas sp.]PPD41579.1 MAG: oxidative damage protection protein [Methylomonas sp.]PPD51972.1 MAG: oxidative damage protection protein [Methylomonas sp.]